MSALGSFFAKRPKSVLFVEVDDFPDLLRRLEGIDPAMPVRDTWYGMREIGVFEPGGNPAVFAARIEKQA